MYLYNFLLLFYIHIFICKSINAMATNQGNQIPLQANGPRKETSRLSHGLSLSFVDFFFLILIFTILIPIGYCRPSQDDNRATLLFIF